MCYLLKLYTSNGLSMSLKRYLPSVLETSLCSNSTPRRSQTRRSRGRRRRRRRRRRFPSIDLPRELSSSSKRNNFRLRGKDNRFFVAEDINVRDAGFVPVAATGNGGSLQRPRGPGDSRSLIHDGEDIEVIEGFDFRDDV